MIFINFSMILCMKIFKLIMLIKGIFTYKYITMYDCKRCGSSFEMKANLKTHLNRKRTCKAVLSDISVSNLLLELPNLGKVVTGGTHTCTNCGKLFSHKSNMYTHRKKCTKSSTASLLAEIQNLKDEVAQLKQSILVAAPAPVSNVVINSDVNIKQQVNMNPFNNCRFNMIGLQKTIDPEIFYRLAKNDPLNGIGAFLYCKYFHPDYPENHVLAVSQKKLNNGEMYVWDNDWILRNISEIATNLYHGARDYIDIVFVTFDPKNYIHIISTERAEELVQENQNRFGRDPTKVEQRDIINNIKNNSPVDISKLRIVVK